MSLEPRFRLTGGSVAAVLSKLAKQRPLPRSITVDHGTELTSKALDQWSWGNRVLVDFIRPGKPTDNALCESFSGRLRDACLNVHEFESIGQARQVIEAWRIDYNEHRSHGALGHLTPSEYARSGPKEGAEGAPLQFSSSTNGAGLK